MNNLLHKRSQITVFIIIGIILLLVFGLMSVLIQDIRPYRNDPEQSKVSRYVSDCLEQVTTEGAVLLALHGGNFDPQSYVELEGLKISVGYDKNNRLATKQELEEELAGYIDNILPICANFSALNLNVRADVPKTSITLEDEDIIAQTRWSLEWKNKTEYMFFAQASVPLGRLHDKADEIIGNIEPDWIDLSALSEAGDITVLPAGGGWFIYLIGEKDLLFAFSAKYDIDSAPVIDIPDELILDHEKPWLYKVNCTDIDGDRLRITDNTAMFDTLPDGSILFTPHIPGSYDVVFECRDEKHTSKKTVRFIVR